MIKKGDIMTTVIKKNHPFVVEIKKVHPNGSKAACECSGIDGKCTKEYALAELRHLSARELADDVYGYYDISEPSYPFYSRSYRECLEQIRRSAMHFLDKMNKEIGDMCEIPPGILAEYNDAVDSIRWISIILTLVEKEITEIACSNPVITADNPVITADVPGYYGKFVATLSTDPAHPGIDVEFIPDEEDCRLSNPRVLFEAGKNGMNAYLWTDGLKEDCTIKAVFS